MSLSSRLHWVVTLCLGLAVSGPLWADGVTRTVESVSGGCKVTLAWEFSGRVESDLIIEERLASGWTVDTKTVPFDLLDATWFSDHVARFAVKPTLLAKAGSINFTVIPAEGSAPGAVSGGWKMYLDGTLEKGTVGGDFALAAAAGTSTDSSMGSTSSGTAASTPVAKPLAVTSFKMLNGGGCQLSYRGARMAGTVVVEGCESLGKKWIELTRAAKSAGDGAIKLDAEGLKGCRFMRMKILVTEE